VKKTRTARSEKHKDGLIQDEVKLFAERNYDSKFAEVQKIKLQEIETKRNNVNLNQQQLKAFGNEEPERATSTIWRMTPLKAEAILLQSSTTEQSSKVETRE
jgi:hypothetical protein